MENSDSMYFFCFCDFAPYMARKVLNTIYIFTLTLYCQNDNMTTKTPEHFPNKKGQS